MNNKKLANIQFSALDLAVVLEGKTILDSYTNGADVAAHLEKWGYLRYWLAEHHNMEGIASSATSVLIGYMASKTSTLRIGSGGIMLPNHSPLMVAEQFGTLETLYPGRIDLGIGRAPGTDSITAAALRRDLNAAKDFPKTVVELQTYFSSDNCNAYVRAIPGEGLNIPIWILGSSTDSAHLAAELGLPYAFASHFSPAQLHQALAVYHQKFRPSVHLQKPYVIACVSAIVADTDEKAIRLATSYKRLFLSVIKDQREKLKPAFNPTDLKMTPADEAALNQMLTYAFIGGPEKVKKGMQQFIDATQVDELMIATAIFDHAARLHSYKLISDFKKE